MNVDNGLVSLKRPGFTVTLDFRPWLSKVSHHRYVLLHAQARRQGQEYWGLLVVDDAEVEYHEAVKVNTGCTATGWTLTKAGANTPALALVYPDACVELTGPQGIATIVEATVDTPDRLPADSLEITERVS